jgi:hypothetical protein
LHDLERWKLVKGSSTYQVSDFGNVRRILKSGKLKPIETFCKRKKWMWAKVRIAERYGEYTVQRLVAQAFLDEPESPGQVLWHKNGLIRDNHAENLQWISKKALGIKTGGMYRSIAVKQIDVKTGEVINFYKSMSIAGRDNYISDEQIRLVIHGKAKTAAGFFWKRDVEGYD